MLLFVRFDLEGGLFLVNDVGAAIPLGRDDDLEDELPFEGVVLLCLRKQFTLLFNGTELFFIEGLALEAVFPAMPLTEALGEGLTLSLEAFFGRPTALPTEPVRLFTFDFFEELCAFAFLEPPCSLLLGCALGDFAATLGILTGGGEGESFAGRP